jgi:hypothetical protein
MRASALTSPYCSTSSFGVRAGIKLSPTSVLEPVVVWVEWMMMASWNDEKKRERERERERGEVREGRKCAYRYLSDMKQP